MEKYQSGFRKLIAWQKAHSLTYSIYIYTREFPSYEQYGLTNQLRRASSSIAAQIAEGSRMPTMNHRKLYYDRAYASSAEVDYFLELAKDLNYIQEETYDVLLKLVNDVSSLTNKLSHSCNTKHTRG